MAKRNKSVSIPAPSLPTETIKFSFEFYDTSQKYCLSDWDKEQIFKTMQRFKDICTKTFYDLQRDRFVYHFREVDWSKTTEPKGFPFIRLNDLQPFHFALLGVNQQLARVFGAYASNVFYVVGLI